MKVGKPEAFGRTKRVAGAYSGGEEPALSQTAPIAATSLLGIPAEEFTPCVRDAVMTLTHQIELLRRDLDQARARVEEMARTADQDMLLPILNRRAFVREISRFIAFAERYSTPSSILYFDLDNFKAVNDAHGHAAGDAVLRHFTNLLGSQIRDSDILARIGGDEFGIILAHVTLDQAQKKGASLAKSLREKPPIWNGRTVKLSFSYGAYELHAGENVDAALAEADQAMYAQKRSAPKLP